MVNPLSRNRKYLLIYLSMWVFIMVAHFFFLYFYKSVKPGHIIMDSLVYNGLFLLFGYGIWYIVRYNDIELKNILNPMIGHLISAILIIAFWLWTGRLILNFLITDDRYTLFLNELIPVRIILGVMFYVVLILVYYLIIYNQDFKSRIEREGKIEAKSKEAELNSLKAQINPHFIFNSLNSISSLTMTDPSKAQDMIVKLSDFFRTSLSRGKEQFITLEEEIDFSKTYLSIEKVRFGDKMKFLTSIEPGIEKMMVPHLILQPILENAIKHGVQESTELVIINLTCKKKENGIVIQIDNRIEEAKRAKGNGIGLQNVRERLKLIYGDNNLLITTRNENKYETRIYIPG